MERRSTRGEVIDFVAMTRGTVLARNWPRGHVATARTATAIGRRREAAMLPLVGQTVGRYTVLGRIGAGAMGTVFLASDPQLGRNIALKLLASRTTGRLLDEARALAKLQHPNVVAIHDVGWWSGRVYLAMEYVEGVSLETWLLSCTDWQQRLAAFVQAAEGLAAAHRAGIVHHDVKPQNIMVGNDGRVRLVDFGLARSPEDAWGAPAGTPRYMAPEQRRGDAADARSDQFSLCVALFEALFGIHPFGDSTQREAAMCAGQIVAPTANSVPAATRDAILRGLAAQPDQRHPSIEALIAALVPEPRRPVWLVPGLTGVLAAALGVALAVASAPDRGPWDDILAASNLPPTQVTPIAGDPLGVTVHRLSNGLTVTISPNRELPRVRAMLRLHAGFADAPGVAELAQGMAYRGTRAIGTTNFAAEKPQLAAVRDLYALRAKQPALRPAVDPLIDLHSSLASLFQVRNEYTLVLHDLGISVNRGNTTSDETRFEIEVPSNRLEAWAQLEADRWANRVFRGFREQVGETLGWFRNTQADQQRRIVDAGRRSLFAGHPYGQQESIRTIIDEPYAEVEKFMTDWFVPNNAELILVGDVDPVTAIPMLERAFAVWKPRMLPERTKAAPKPFAGAEPIRLATATRPEVHAMFQLPPIDRADGPAVEVLMRLFGRVVELEHDLDELPVTFAAKTWRAEQAAMGFVGATPKTSATLDDAARELDALLRRIRDGKFSDETLEIVKRSFRLTRLLEARAFEQRLAYLSRDPMRGAWREQVEREAAIEKVTRADVLRVAKQALGRPWQIVRVERGKVELAPIPWPSQPATWYPNERSAAAQAIAARPVVPVQWKLHAAGRDYVERVTPAGALVGVHAPESELFDLSYRYEAGAGTVPLACVAIDTNRGQPAVLAATWKLGIRIVMSCTESNFELRLQGFDRDLPAAIALAERLFEAPTAAQWQHQRAMAERNVIERRAMPHVVDAALRYHGLVGRRAPIFHAYDLRLYRSATPATLQANLDTLRRAPGLIGYHGPRAIDDVAALLPQRGAGKPTPLRTTKLAGGKPRVYLLHAPALSDDAHVAINVGLDDVGAPGSAADRLADYELFWQYWHADLHPHWIRLKTIARSDTSLSITARRDPAMLAFRIKTSARDAAKILTSTLAELAAPIDPAIVARAKPELDERYRTEWYPRAELASRVANWRLQGYRTDPRPIHQLRLAQLTADDVAAIADIVRRAPRAITIYGNLARLDRAALAKHGEIVELTLDELLPVAR